MRVAMDRNRLRYVTSAALAALLGLGLLSACTADYVTGLPPKANRSIQTVTVATGDRARARAIEVLTAQAARADTKLLHVGVGGVDVQLTATALLAHLQHNTPVVATDAQSAPSGRLMADEAEWPPTISDYYTLVTRPASGGTQAIALNYTEVSFSPLGGFIDSNMQISVSGGTSPRGFTVAAPAKWTMPAGSVSTSIDFDMSACQSLTATTVHHYADIFWESDTYKSSSSSDNAPSPCSCGPATDQQTTGARIVAASVNIPVGGLRPAAAAGDGGDPPCPGDGIGGGGGGGYGGSGHTACVVRDWYDGDTGAFLYREVLFCYEE